MPFYIFFIELCLFAFIFILLYKFSQNRQIRKQGKKLFRIISSLFTLTILYSLIVFHPSYILFPYLYLIFLFIWLFITFYFLFYIVFEKKTVLRLHLNDCLFFFIVTFIIVFFLMQYHPILLVSTFVLRFLTLEGSLLLFSLILLAFSRSYDSKTNLFLLGFACITIANFFRLFFIFDFKGIFFLSGECLWICGLLFIFYALLSFRKETDKTYFLTLEKGFPIKTLLILTVFKVSIICFLAFFIIAYFTGMVSGEILLTVPMFLIIYSLFSFILSFYWSSFFDKSFKKIKGNINFFMGNKNSSYREDTFPTDEFTIMQQNIISILIDLDKNDFLLSYLNKITTQTAHDSRSSLAALNVMVTHSSAISEENKKTVIKTLNTMNISFNTLLEKLKTLKMKKR
jgi:hypothetical protein